MSDNESDKGESSVKADKKAPVFTEKEEMVLKAAWRCLKSGPPEVDMEKLMKACGFNTMKTTANTWGVIKKKLFSDVNGSLPTAPNTPAKPKATPKGKKGAATATPSKKRGKKDVDSDDDDEDEGRSLLQKRSRINKAQDSNDE